MAENQGYSHPLNNKTIKTIKHTQERTPQKSYFLSPSFRVFFFASLGNRRQRAGLAPQVGRIEKYPLNTDILKSFGRMVGGGCRFSLFSALCRVVYRLSYMLVYLDT